MSCMLVRPTSPLLHGKYATTEPGKVVCKCSTTKPPITDLPIPGLPRIHKTFAGESNRFFNQFLNSGISRTHFPVSLYLCFWTARSWPSTCQWEGDSHWCNSSLIADCAFLWTKLRSPNGQLNWLFWKAIERVTNDVTNSLINKAGSRFLMFYASSYKFSVQNYRSGLKESNQQSSWSLPWSQGAERNLTPSSYVPDRGDRHRSLQRYRSTYYSHPIQSLTFLRLHWTDSTVTAVFFVEGMDVREGSCAPFGNWLPVACNTLQPSIFLRSTPLR